MVFNKNNIFFVLLAFIYAQNPIDLYNNSIHTHTLIGTIEDGIEKPRDLDFHPIIDNQLWVLNQGEDAYQNNSQNTRSVCIPINLNLIFTIFDSDDDGICCESGEGSYIISDCNNTYASGGDYESSESTSFVVESSCPNSCAEDESIIQITINTDDWAKEVSWKLTDASENLVFAKKLEPGGSTVIYNNVGMHNQESEYIKDSYSRHFMHTASAIAFDNQGFFANTLECKDANNNINGFFSGPTLWDSDLSVYGNVNQNGPLLGSHLDMIHQSPFSMGIDYAGLGNVYWVFDGYHSSIVRYDFATPHEAGGHDHSDGKVWRYDEIEISMHDGIPSHLVFDDNTGSLYIADTGNQRILVFDTLSGNYLEELNPYGESLDQYWLMELTNETDLEKIAKILLSSGPEIVIIKRGSRGAFLATNDTKINVPVYDKIDLFDPTGAGDSFAGGLVGYFSKNGENNLKEAMIHATVTASYTVSDFGVKGLVASSEKSFESRCKYLRKKI